jgi:hypothetical protein
MAQVVYGESFASYHTSFTTESFHYEFILNLPLVGSKIKCLVWRNTTKPLVTDDKHTNRTCGTQKPDFEHICTSIMWNWCSSWGTHKCENSRHILSTVLYCKTTTYVWKRHENILQSTHSSGHCLCVPWCRQSVAILTTQASPRANCGGWSGSGTGFSKYFGFPIRIIPPMHHTNSFIILQQLRVIK